MSGHSLVKLVFYQESHYVYATNHHFCSSGDLRLAAPSLTGTCDRPPQPRCSSLTLFSMSSSTISRFSLSMAISRAVLPSGSTQLMLSEGVQFCVRWRSLKQSPDTSQTSTDGLT